VSLAVVLIFVVASYLASSIRSKDRSSVSVVQEPTVSQLPSGIALLGNVEDDEHNKEDVSKEKQAESPPKYDKAKAEQGGQEEYSSRTAQVPSSSATAFASASSSASASASSAATGSVSGSAIATPAPARIRPEPAAREQPGGGDMVAPAGPRARVSGSQSRHETQPGSGDVTRLGDGVPNKVKKAVDSAW
jgi:hypothetical protein